MDADLTQWGPHFVTGLLGPLVKGFCAGVRTEADGSVSTESGRVTELVARPVLSLWWPHLAAWSSRWPASVASVVWHFDSLALRLFNQNPGSRSRVLPGTHRDVLVINRRTCFPDHVRARCS